MSINLSDYEKFEEIVKSNFYFLEKLYDFHLSPGQQNNNVKIIRYKSSRVFVHLTYGPPAFEPEMAFGRIGIDDVPGEYSFDQGDLILLESCANWQWQPHYPNHMIGLVSEFARLLMECGTACLKGDEAVFVEMKNMRKQMVSEWYQQEKEKEVRKKALKAWKDKDYSTVVDSYEVIEDVLTKSEKMRLDYAKKKLS